MLSRLSFLPNPILLMKHFLLSLSLGAFCVGSALPATAQSRPEITPATIAPSTPSEVVPSTPIVEVRRIEEGLAYGMHNRPGTDSDCYGSFDPTDDFTAQCIEPFPVSAFAGTVITTDDGEGILYYVKQFDRNQTGVGVDTLAAYNFDTGEQLEELEITYFDADGNEIPFSADLPQWSDGGLDTATGELILLGRFQACTAEAGGQLWSLNVETREARPLITFTDPDNCPLSGAYDNENNRFIGMVPDAGFEGFYQADLTTGETVGMVPLPSDLFMDTVASFIQGGATNFGVDDDPTNNEAWIFLFEGVNPDLASSARLITFGDDGIIDGSINNGAIDIKSDWVEVLTSGFKSQPVAVANEAGATPGAFEFIGVFPNPFQVSATVMLRAEQPVAHATVKAYDVLGRAVATLHDGPLAATQHQFGLEARGLPTGVYFVSVRSGDFSQTKKVVLID